MGVRSAIQQAIGCVPPCPQHPYTKEPRQRASQTAAQLEYRKGIAGDTGSYPLDADGMHGHADRAQVARGSMRCHSSSHVQCAVGAPCARDGGHRLSQRPAPSRFVANPLRGSAPPRSRNVVLQEVGARCASSIMPSCPCLSHSRVPCREGSLLAIPGCRLTWSDLLLQATSSDNTVAEQRRLAAEQLVERTSSNGASPSGGTSNGAHANGANGASYTMRENGVSTNGNGASRWACQHHIGALMVDWQHVCASQL